MGAFVVPSVAANSMPPVPPVPPPAAMLCSGMIGAPPPMEVTLEALLSRTMPSAMWTASATPGLAAPEVRGLARAGVKPEAVSSKGRTMRVEARKQWPQTYHTVCVETSSTGWPWKQFSHRCCWGGSSKGWKVRHLGTACLVCTEELTCLQARHTLAAHSLSKVRSQYMQAGMGKEKPRQFSN